MVLDKVDVSVVIVNYKTKDITLNCIKSIFEHTKGISFEVILVDNASHDGIIEEIKQKFTNVLTIQSDKNLGFAGGNNLGIRASKGKYVLLLNSDTILLNNALKIFFDFMEKPESENIGVVGTFLIDQEENVIYSDGKFFPISAGIGELFPIFRRFIRVNDFKKYNEIPEGYIKKVDYVIGADMFVRKKLFEEVGLLDDSFFMYYEEADFQKRVQKKGYRIALIKGPKIIHFESGSFKVSEFRKITKLVSSLRYMKRWYPLFYPLYKTFLILYSLFEYIKAIFSRNGSKMLLYHIVRESYQLYS